MFQVFIMKMYWILSNAFYKSFESIIAFVSFMVLKYIIFNDLYMLKHSCIPSINPIYSWCMIFLMCWWIWFLVFCWESLLVSSSEIMVCGFLSCSVLVRLQYESNDGLITWVWKCLFPSIFWRSLGRINSFINAW